MISRLMALEQKYGGICYAPARKVSSVGSELSTGYEMRGGDRMTFHGYASAYADVLSQRTPSVIVELGILCGTGLAIWCDLFPAARIVGLDIDLGHFEKAKERLLAQGAFTNNAPEVYEFDELAPFASRVLREIFGAHKVDFVIDDALHSDAAVINSFAGFQPYLAAECAYIIEDNDTAYAALRFRYPRFRWRREPLLTIATRGARGQ